MISTFFDENTYFPTIRTRQAELRGYSQLDEVRKGKITPLLTLERWPKAVDFSKSAEKVAELMKGRPYFLDLTTDARHLVDHYRELRNPTGAFSAWRQLVSSSESAIPVAQLSSDARQRDTAKQAQEIERSTGKIGFRIRDFSIDTPLVIGALSALDDPRNAVIFVDCQYIRNAVSAYVAASIATINQLRTEFPELFIVLLSTSFPQSTVSFSDASQNRGGIDILERELHSRIGGSAVAAYGDHASIHSVVYDDVTIMKWAARIDYPKELEWLFERRPGDRSEGGYVSAAKEIVKLHPEIRNSDIWGEQMIQEAAGGSLVGKAPASWIAVRVNIHLARQIDFSERLALSDDEDDELDGEAEDLV